MEFEELEKHVKAMQAMATEANAKRKNFQTKGNESLYQQSLGEALGVGKCLALFVADYPAEMEILTAPVGS